MSAADGVKQLSQFQGMVDKELHQFEQTQSVSSFAFPLLSSAQCDVVRECAEKHGLGPIVKTKDGDRLVVWKKDRLPASEEDQQKADVESRFDEQRQFLLWDASQGTETQLHAPK